MQSINSFVAGEHGQTKGSRMRIAQQIQSGAGEFWRNKANSSVERMGKESLGKIWEYDNRKQNEKKKDNKEFQGLGESI